MHILTQIILQIIQRVKHIILFLKKNESFQCARWNLPLINFMTLEKRYLFLRLITEKLQVLQRKYIWNKEIQICQRQVIMIFHPISKIHVGIKARGLVLKSLSKLGRRKILNILLLAEFSTRAFIILSRLLIPWSRMWQRDRLCATSHNSDRESCQVQGLITIIWRQQLI